MNWHPSLCNCGLPSYYQSGIQVLTASVSYDDCIIMGTLVSILPLNFCYWHTNFTWSLCTLVLEHTAACAVHRFLRTRVLEHTAECAVHRSLRTLVLEHTAECAVHRSLRTLVLEHTAECAVHRSLRTRVLVVSLEYTLSTIFSISFRFVPFRFESVGLCAHEC